jgi:hypothetical protein
MLLVAIRYQFYGDVVAVSKTCFWLPYLIILWGYSGCKQDMLVVVPYQFYGDIVALARRCET